MKRLIVVCAWIAAAAAATGCSGDGPPAEPPFRPFGTEPRPTTGSEPTGGGRSEPTIGGHEDPSLADSIAQACARACAHIEVTCPGTEGENCAQECAGDAPPGCERQFRDVLLCIARAPLDCANGQIPAGVCDAPFIAFNNCIMSNPTPEGAGSP
jgi:hypothetical protein